MTPEVAMAKLAHIPKAFPKALARAFNRAKTAGQAEAWRQVKATYTIKRKDFLEAVRKGTRATANKLKAEIFFTGKVLSLTKFVVKPAGVQRKAPNKKKPITVAVKQGGGKPLKHAFVAQMSSGHKGVFHRFSVRSTPIKESYGLSVPQMLGNNEVRQAIERQMGEVAEKRLDHEVNAIIEGKTR